MTSILDYDLINIGDLHIKVLDCLEVLLVFVVIWILLKIIINPIIRRISAKKEVDEGRQYAITQFTKYILYTLGLLLALQSLGLNISLLIAGSAALLVGIGLGLQQTFNDLISGIILLIEGSVEVGDVVYLDGIVGRVFRIGLRTSKVEDRDKNVIIVPNSKLITEKVYNWSHNAHATRFNIEVGVSYASDVEKVKEILLEAVQGISGIDQSPPPSVQFIGFGNSSLEFKLFFYSNNFMHADQIKSTIRFRIIDLFRKHKVEIPFPQRDLWIKNDAALSAHVTLDNDILPGALN